MKSDWRLIEDAVALAGLDEEFERTIESLRRVARAADDIGLEFEMRIGLWIMNGGPDKAEALHHALDALPDWVLEEKSW